MMMHSVCTTMPLYMTPKNFTQEYVLDLRVPQKQKQATLHYTPVHPEVNNSDYMINFSNNKIIQPLFINPVNINPFTQPEISPKVLPPKESSLISSPTSIPSGHESPSSSSISSDPPQNVPTSAGSPGGSKSSRPFKSLTKDPFIGIKTAVNFLHEDVDYDTFREKMLAQTGINYNNSNLNMRRKTNHNENNTDPVYWEKRKKNNEAAKKSRDARKAREDEIAIRCAYLEQENLKLKLKIAAVQNDTERLQKIVYRV